MNLFQRLRRRRAAPQSRQHTQLTRETDQTIALGGGLWQVNERERGPYQREELLEQALLAWQTNPLARRIVELTTQYVVGGGVHLSCEDAPTHQFLKTFWHHRLNRMDTRVMEWCDELTRSGNLFILLTTDANGMSYVRAVPAAQMERIEHQPNDVEQPAGYYPKASLEDPDPAPWAAYDPQRDQPNEQGQFSTVMLHYAVNRPVGALWGESDLAPLLRWISRYAHWLEDRARLNRYRNAFLYVVRGRFLSESERLAHQRALNAHPPTPGSILVADENEEWSVIAPQLGAHDAATDGLALKKMIATGAGVPLHFLAEPESATRTTAEASGGPSYRHYEQRQRFFLWMLNDLLRIILCRKAMRTTSVNAEEPIQLIGADISARDNVALSQAARNAVEAFAPLHELGLMKDHELLRLVYRFAGESADWNGQQGSSYSKEAMA